MPKSSYYVIEYRTSPSPGVERWERLNDRQYGSRTETQEALAFLRYHGSGSECRAVRHQVEVMDW